jgi:glycosyltransferase involved in cell wall biosynthesis
MPPLQSKESSGQRGEFRMISVLILTRNEENDLPGCLESVAWSDDVYVFDSQSTDRTGEIAKGRGAHFVQRKFDNYAAQKNAALLELPFKNEWIFLLDADERPTEELTAEMPRAISSAPDGVNGFSMRRRDFWRGTWLKHAQITPYYIRLVRKGKARFRREVNEVLEVDGRTLPLQAPLDHYPFSKGIRHWIDKHNVYSTMEAELIVSGSSKKTVSRRSAFFQRDFYKRRAVLKALFYRFPARPLIKWVYMLFIRGGILDGRAGLAYSTMQAIYEYFIVLKAQELFERNAECGVQGTSPFSQRDRPTDTL